MTETDTVSKLQMTSTHDLFHQKFRPSDLVVETGVGDEIVLLHLGNSSYYGLDRVGALIWRYLKDGLTPTETCARLAEEFDVTPARAEADARIFLDDLRANDIIVDDIGKA